MPARIPDVEMYYIFLITYIFVVFLMLLNFLLAIAVDGYAKVQEQIESLEAESSFFVDLLTVNTHNVQYAKNGWPDRDRNLQLLYQNGGTEVPEDELQELFQGCPGGSRGYQSYYLDVKRDDDSDVDEELSRAKS